MTQLLCANSPVIDARHERRMSDIELAELIDIDLFGFRELIAENESQVARFGRVDLTAGSYQLNQQQSAYLAKSLNVFLGQMAAASVEEAFDAGKLKYMSDADLAEVIGVADLQNFKGLIADTRANNAKLGRVKMVAGSYLLDRQQCTFLILALSYRLGQAATVSVEDAFSNLAQLPFRSDSANAASMMLH